ncbi:hypothetical protein K469DRAFT_711030 [Zopfia rhizophila CBS 207.26]|uniref:F-box domain-containing protein n=1 Tax=Zopfia rhizophila CBS 207.26 TaxID=1314779 RepID=A0A6A6DYM2_9PEZI|nr:hypothetical protein K469DRAFT_711030 [Zopfia rhizophila CBS 207.26]
MANITSIPAELLVDICERLRNTGQRSLLSLLLTCRALRNVAHEVLYQHICLDTDLSTHSPLTKFIQQSRSMHLVQSFRLNKFFQVMEQPISDFESLYRLLPTMTQLKTFSCFFDPSAFGHCNCPGKVLEKLLETLPPTVVNLELDMDGYEGLHQPIYQGLGWLMPQLQILRLHVDSLWTNMFEFSQQNACTLETSTADQMSISKKRITSNLRIFVIIFRLSRNRVLNDSMVRRHICPVTYRGNTPGASLWERMPQGADSLTPSFFSSRILNLREKGAFPHLQRFLRVYPGKGGPHISMGMHFHYNVCDICTNRVVAVPVVDVPLQPSSFDDDIETLHLLRDHEGKDLLGASITKLIQFFEGSLCWTELCNGSRLPPPINESNNTTHEFERSALLDRPTAEATYGSRDMDCSLWKREKEVGQTILRARMSEGGEDEGPLLEILPPGWEFVESGLGHLFADWGVRQSG